MATVSSKNLNLGHALGGASPSCHAPPNKQGGLRGHFTSSHEIRYYTLLPYRAGCISAI